MFLTIFCFVLVILVIFLFLVRSASKDQQKAQQRERAQHLASAYDRFKALVERRHITCTSGESIEALANELAKSPFQGELPEEPLSEAAQELQATDRMVTLRTLRYFMQCCIDQMEAQGELRQRYDKRQRIDEMIRLSNVGDVLVWDDAFGGYLKLAVEGYSSIINEHFSELSVGDDTVPDFDALRRLAGAYGQLYALCMRLSLVTLHARAPEEGRPLLEALAEMGRDVVERMQQLPYDAMRQCEDYISEGRTDSLSISFDLKVPQEVYDQRRQRSEELFLLWDPDEISTHLSDNKKKL